MSRILLVEDEKILRRELGRFLTDQDHDVEEAGSVAEALAKGSLDRFDLVITDLRLPGAPGTELIQKGREPPVMVITAYSSPENREEAINRGAASYMPKPVKHDQMHLVVERLLAQGLLRHWTAAQAKAVGAISPSGEMIGDCPAICRVRELIARFAPTDDPILITGESGTGKELVANDIYALSRRSKKPFVKFNCGAMVKGLVASELFGVEKEVAGANTTARPGLFEAADGGTLFLDEIGDLPTEAQACLLRVLEDGKVRRISEKVGAKERTVNVRVLAATNLDLEQRVRDGNFRNDLYHRLRGFDIRLPSLRDRGDDIEKIALHLVKQIAKEFSKGDLALEPEALTAVRAHGWPGNVRELVKAVRRGVVLSDSRFITLEQLGIDGPAVLPAQGPVLLNESRDARYRRVIRANEASMSETKLARLLNLTRTGLWKVRRRLKIKRRRMLRPRTLRFLRKRGR